MTDRELMQQALDALEEIHPDNMTTIAEKSWSKAIEALRAVLAQPEPYAAQAAMVAQQTQGRMHVDPVTGDVGIGTVKPQREWQTLTDDEIRIAWGPYFSRGVDVARVIEALLKRKNT